MKDKVDLVKEKSKGFKESANREFEEHTSAILYIRMSE